MSDVVLALSSLSPPQGVSLQDLLSKLGRPFKEYELWALSHACLSAVGTHPRHPGDTRAAVPCSALRPTDGRVHTGSQGHPRGASALGSGPTESGRRCLTAGLRAGDQLAHSLSTGRCCPQGGEMDCGDIRRDTALWPPNSTPRGSETGLLSSPSPSASSFLSSFLSPASASSSHRPALGQEGGSEGPVSCPPGPPVGRGGGRASALAPLLHPRVPWVTRGALGWPGGCPPPLQAPGEQGSAVIPALTSPSAAAYLCPDSVLVAEDGAVLFGPPPANGGYRRAWLALRGVPTPATGL